MSKKHIIGLLSLAVVVITLVLIWPSDERRIKRLVKEGVAAVEAKDIEGIMSKFSFNYRDDYGMTYIYLKETLKREFQKLSNVSVEYEHLQTKIFRVKEGRETFELDRAIVEVDARVLATIGTETGYIIGDPKSPLHLKFTFEKERLNWRIVKIEGII